MSARRAALRRSVAPGAGLLTVAALIASTAAFATRIDSTKTLPRFARGDPAGAYTRDAIGPLTPVSARFTRERLGPSAPLDTTMEPDAPPLRRPTTVTPPPDQSIRGTPGAFPGLAPGGWVLNVRMVPDRTTVSAGEEIRYRMIVGNTGTGEFRGRSFTLEWHTPTGTFGRNALDQCSLLPLAILRALCAAPRISFTPGLGDARHERFNSSGLVALDPGEQYIHDWFVQVLPSATEGTTYVNHAHLIVNIDGRDHLITTGDVVVTVVA